MVSCMLVAALYLAETNIYVELSVPTVPVSSSSPSNQSASPSGGIPNRESHGEMLKVTLRRRLDNFLIYDLGMGDFNYALYIILFAAPLILNFFTERRKKLVEEELEELI